MSDPRSKIRMTRRGVAGRGYTVLESLIALSLIAMVVVFTGKVIVTSLGFIGSTGSNRDFRNTESDFQRAARSRTQAIEWTQATVEFIRRLGFDRVATSCGAAECVIPPGATPNGATPPFDVGPPLPAGFQCGKVILEDWDGPDPNTYDPSRLRLVTVEIYQYSQGGTDCTDIQDDQAPYLRAQTGISVRSAPTPTPTP